MKKYIWLYLTAIVSIVYHQQAKAQYYYDGQKRVIQGYNPDVDDVVGTPFLSEKWIFGTITNAQDKIFANVRLKYDVLDDMILFAGANNELLGFNENIQKFTLDHKTFANGFPKVDTLKTSSYYQVLTDGKALLLKHYSKHIEKSYVYGSAVPKLRFVDDEAWYMFSNGKMARIEPNSKSVINAIGDKKGELLSFVSANKNVKGADGLTMLVTYYNSLP